MGHMVEEGVLMLGLLVTGPFPKRLYFKHQIQVRGSGNLTSENSSEASSKECPPVSLTNTSLDLRCAVRYGRYEDE